MGYRLPAPSTLNVPDASSVIPMSESDRERWDRRYSDQDYLPRTEPTPFLEESLPLIARGRALVVACGAGRNALRLAAAGFQVDGYDVSPVAIGLARTEADRRGVDVNFQAVDMNEIEVPAGKYDLITMFRYMNRPLWPRLVRALAPAGWLVMETHLRSPHPVSGPQDPEMRLAPNELLDAFRDLRVVYYRESYEPSDRNGEMSSVARLLACNGDPGW